MTFDHGAAEQLAGEAAEAMQEATSGSGGGVKLQREVFRAKRTKRLEINTVNR